MSQDFEERIAQDVPGVETVQAPASGHRVLGHPRALLARIALPKVLQNDLLLGLGTGSQLWAEDLTGLDVVVHECQGLSLGKEPK